MCFSFFSVFVLCSIIIIWPQKKMFEISSIKRDPRIISFETCRDKLVSFYDLSRTKEIIYGHLLKRRCLPRSKM